MHPRGQRRGAGVGQRGEGDDRGVPGVTRPDREPDAVPEQPAEHCRHRPRRRGDGIGHHQFALGDDMWQRGTEPGEQEPVHRHTGQDGAVQHRSDYLSQYQGRDTEREYCAHGVADQQYLTSPPAVEQDADERAERSVWKHRDRERGSDSGRSCRSLGGEEEQSGQTDLESTVTGLRGQSGGEQLAEVLALHYVAELADEPADAFHLVRLLTWGWVRPCWISLGCRGSPAAWIACCVDRRPCGGAGSAHGVIVHVKWPISFTVSHQANPALALCAPAPTKGTRGGPRSGQVPGASVRWVSDR